MKRILVFIALLIINKSWSQRMPDEYSDTLGFIIHGYMYTHDKPDENRSAELLILFLECDSSGRITKTHILSDQKNLGSTFNALKDINPQVFEKWSFPIFKNKVIVVTIYASQDFKAKDNYVGAMRHSPFFILKGCDYKPITEFVICNLYYFLPLSDNGPRCLIVTADRKEPPKNPLLKTVSVDFQGFKLAKSYP